MLECLDGQFIVDDEDSPFSDEDTDEYNITEPFDDAYKKKAKKILNNTTGKLRRQGIANNSDDDDDVVRP